MNSLMSKDEQHTLLEPNNDNSSFIANVNLLVSHLTEILSVNNKFTEQQVDELTSLVNVDITELIKDIQKGTKDGGRKIDIDLFKNYKDYNENMSLSDKQALYANADKAPKYSSANIYFFDNTILNIPFKQDSLAVEISTNNELYNQFINSIEFDNKRDDTVIVEAPVEVSTVMVRVYDDNKASNIYKIVLNTTTPNLIKSTNTLSYAWVDYTSSLQVLTTYIAKLLEVFEKLDEIINLPVEADKLLQQLKDKGAEQIADIIAEGTTQYNRSKTEADRSELKANESEQAWNNLASAHATAVSVSSDNPASVVYNNGVFNFSIPRAADGQTPIGLSLANFDVSTNSGHLTFRVQQCDFDSCDAYINDKGELILALKNPSIGDV